MSRQPRGWADRPASKPASKPSEDVRYGEEVVFEVKPSGEVVKREREEVADMPPVEQVVEVFSAPSEPSAVSAVPEELQVLVPEGFFEGLVGVITNVEIRPFPALGTNAVVVEITDDEGKKYSEPLWVREVVGARSKLGSFVRVLGRNPRLWIGKRVRIVSWRQAYRAIELLE